MSHKLSAPSKEMDTDHDAPHLPLKDEADLCIKGIESALLAVFHSSQKLNNHRVDDNLYPRLKILTTRAINWQY